jgi:hypothetical protein
VHPPSICLTNKAIGRRGQVVAGFAVVLDPVDGLLRMLDAYAEREGFGFEPDTGIVQEVEDVAGAVAGGEDYV